MSFEQPLPKSLSPSRLADFQACPRRYQYASIERIPQPPPTPRPRADSCTSSSNTSSAARPRTDHRARSRVVDPAIDAILTEDVQQDIAMDDAMLARLLVETEADHRDVLRDGGPARGHPRGRGAAPRRDVDGARSSASSTGSTATRREPHDRRLQDRRACRIATTTLRPSRTPSSTPRLRGEAGRAAHQIRLLYVAQGEAIERSVTEVVVQARRNAAANAWERINRYYADGEFPATPSRTPAASARYKDLCRAERCAGCRRANP